MNQTALWVDSVTFGEIRVITSILLIGLTFSVQAETPSQTEPPAEELSVRVRELVLRLDDDAMAEREAAEKALTDLGSDVLNLLPSVTPNTPAEVKERLGRIREALEKAAAEAVIAPTRVSLEGEMSVTAAFRAFEDQTDNRVVGFQRREGDVSVSIKDATYWEALDQLLDEADLSINPFGGEPHAIEVVARPEGQLPRSAGADYRGVFRFEAIRLEARRELRNPTVDTLRLTISVTWEPRISAIAFRQPLDQIEAVSELGDPIYLGDTPPVLNASVASGISAAELAIPLELPERRIRRIAKLNGVMTVLLPGRVEAFEFENLAEAQGVVARKAGVSVTFERMRKNLDLYEVRMALRFDDAGDALASHRGWVYSNEAYVLDADGKRVDNVGGHPTRQLPDEIGFAYMFELPSGPEKCKFVYKTPALILHVPVEYELREILLP